MVILGAAGVLAASGCGGGADRVSDDERERGRSREEELSTVPDPGPGLEPGPPSSITVGWETDFATRAVPLSEFRAGGPGKDGIPAIDEPRFVTVGETDFLAPEEPVVALELNGKARAYPLQILVWHEIVNDVLAGVPVLVTFCPLCNTAIVFQRRIDDRTLDFGTTGNLRDSDLVMYDRQTESWWQQFGGHAVVGALTGATLDQIPARIVAWRDFEREHAEGTVLSRETGYDRPYGSNPYPGYDDVDSAPAFATRNSGDDRLPAKERVVFIERGDEALAIPFSTLRREHVVRLEVGGRSLTVRWRAGVASSLDRASVAAGRDVGTAEVREGGRLVAFSEPFWFAVAAFRPNVRIVR